MKNLLVILMVLFSIVVSSCAIKPGNGDLSPAELKTAGDATIAKQQNVAQAYAHTNFITPLKKENTHADS